MDRVNASASTRELRQPSTIRNRVLQQMERAVSRVEHERADVATEERIFEQAADRIAGVEVLKPAADPPFGQALTRPAGLDKSVPMTQVQAV